MRRAARGPSVILSSMAIEFRGVSFPPLHDFTADGSGRRGDRDHRRERRRARARCCGWPRDSTSRSPARWSFMAPAATAGRPASWISRPSTCFDRAFAGRPGRVRAGAGARWGSIGCEATGGTLLIVSHEAGFASESCATKSGGWMRESSPGAAIRAKCWTPIGGTSPRSSAPGARRFRIPSAPRCGAATGARRFRARNAGRDGHADQRLAERRGSHGSRAAPLPGRRGRSGDRHHDSHARGAGCLRHEH